MRLTLLSLCFFAAVLPAAAPPQVIARPYVAPIMQFHLEAGKPVPGAVLQCKRDLEEKEFADHGDSYLVLRCNDGIRLRLSNLYFDGNKVTIEVASVR